MENNNVYTELVNEIDKYRVETRKNELYVYKSHQIIVTHTDETYYSMVYDYQLNGIIEILNKYPHASEEGINIQIYELGRTVYRNF